MALDEERDHVHTGVKFLIITLHYGHLRHLVIKTLKNDCCDTYFIQVSQNVLQISSLENTYWIIDVTWVLVYYSSPEVSCINHDFQHVNS